MKLVCDTCGRNWSGEERHIGTKHLACGGKWVEGDAESPSKPGASGDRVVRNAFQPNRDYLLWNRGEWRGWAVSAVTGYRDVFVEALPDYKSGELLFLEDRMRKEVQEGKTFVTDPRGVLELLIRQLARFDASDGVLALGTLLLRAIEIYGTLGAPQTETTHIVAPGAFESATDLKSEDI